jgi:hypothetical protein
MNKISNKKYNEFWNNNEIVSEQKKNDLNNVVIKDGTLNIKKEIKKEVKKEVKKIEEQYKEKFIENEVIKTDIPKKVRIKKNVESKIDDIKNDNINNMDEDLIIVRVDKTYSNNTFNNIIENYNTHYAFFDNKLIKIDESESTINELFKENNLPKPVQKPITLSNHEIYQKYITDNEPYRIYYRGSLIYDSIKNNEIPIIENDYFILFGKNYIYRGIRFEKY